MRRSLFVPGLLVVLSTSGMASIVSFRASGAFDAADGSLSPWLVGKSFVFDIAYDPSASGDLYAWGRTEMGFYDLASFRTTVDGTTYQADAFSTIAVMRGEGTDSVRFAGAAYLDGMNGYLFDLTFIPKAPLESVDVPSDLSALASNSTVTASMRDVEVYGEFFTRGEGTASRIGLGSAPSVPGPAPVIAFVAGGLGAVRRRRR